MKTETLLASAACLFGLFCARRGTNPLTAATHGLVNAHAAALLLRDAARAAWAMRSRWQEYRQQVMRSL